MNKLSIISFILLSFLTAHASLHAGFKERMKERLPAILVAKDKGSKSIQEAHSRKMKDLFPSPYPTNTSKRDVHPNKGGVSKSMGGRVSKFQHEINNSTMGASFQEEEEATITPLLFIIK